MCRETAIAMYRDSRFQRVPYQTQGTPFEVWPGPTPRALQKKTPAWGEPAGVHGIGCRVSVSADTGKLTFYRVVRPALLFSGRSYKPPVHSRQKRG
jgi:hypothetical protein